MRPALASVREELADRYGPLPEAARNLFAVAACAAELVRRGVTTAAAQGKYVRFGPLDLPDSAALSGPLALPRDNPQAGGAPDPRPDAGHAGRRRAGLGCRRPRLGPRSGMPLGAVSMAP